MSKKIIISIGLIVGILTPLILSDIYSLNFTKLLKSFVCGLHLLALIFVIIFDYQSKLKIQKGLMWTAFLNYPLLLTADSMNIFGEKTYIIVFIGLWLYAAAIGGWVFTGKYTR